MENETETQKPKKKIYKRWWFWVLAIIAIFIFIGVIGGPSQPQKVGEVPTGEQKTSNETQAEFKVGDQVKLGSSVVTVNKVEFSQGGQFTKPAEGNEWLNLNVTVENTGSSQQYLTTLGQMFVRDSEGNSYQVAVTDKVLENPTFGLDGTIIAKSKRTGWVGFEIRKGASGLKFQYNGSMFGGGTILVNLGR